MNRIPDDPVVAEIHAIRQALLDECGGDIDEYGRRARARQNPWGRKIITKPFRDRTARSVKPESPVTGVPSGKTNPASG